MNNSKELKKIAIIVDDNKRTSLIEWSYFNKDILCRYEIIANEITADLLRGTLNMPITVLSSGTVDGYRELANMVDKKSIDILIFFGNPAKVDIHQTGINDLLVLAIDQDIVTACNTASADLIIRSLDAQSITEKWKEDNNPPGLNVPYMPSVRHGVLSSFTG